MSTVTSLERLQSVVSSTIETARARMEDHIHWVFLIPAFLIYIPFMVVPALGLFGLSGFQWSGIGSMTFIGSENFASAVDDSVVYTALSNNVQVGIWSIVLQAGLGLLLALAINRFSSRIRQFFQVAFLVPMALMSVAVSLIWAYMYNPSYGVITTFLNALGSDWTPQFLGDPSIALFAVIIVACWQWTGFRVILWLAGLDSIDSSLIEAARIDGAGPLQRFRYVILPLLKPVAVFILLYTVIGSFNSFAYFWVMTQGGPGHATEVMVTWIYKISFLQSNFGQAAAVSVILFVIVLVLSLLNLRIGDRESGGSV